MNIALVGTESLDELEALLSGAFSDVPNRGKPRPVAAPPAKGRPFATNSRKHLRILPVKEKKSLELYVMRCCCCACRRCRRCVLLLPYYAAPPLLQPTHWHLSPVRYFDLSPVVGKWKAGVDHYVSDLVAGEGEGSLCSYLKNMGWANALSGGLYVTHQDCASWLLQIDLTAEGLGRIDDIVEAFFAYVELLPTTTTTTTTMPSCCCCRRHYYRGYCRSCASLLVPTSPRLTFLPFSLSPGT